MPKAFGLDFGTTNSAVACTTEKGVETTPVHRSVLYFEPKTPTATGNDAIDRYLASDDKGRLMQAVNAVLAKLALTGTNVYGRQYSVVDHLTDSAQDLKNVADTRFGAFEGPGVVGRPVRYSNANSHDDN